MSSQLSAIKESILQAERAANRAEGSVSLLAVTKGRDTATIASLAQAGQLSFGENYLQEALPKITALKDYALSWHFIGRLQRRKLDKVATHFHWVHSLCKASEAKTLSLCRTKHSLKPLQVCMQVNISDDENKSGVSAQEAATLCFAIQNLPGLQLRGLMTILENNLSETQQRAHYQSLHQLYLKLNRQGFKLDTLSMGMSADFSTAIGEGATLVRVGRALFRTQEDAC